MQYTRAQIYNAIMDAADHIERFPGEYKFISIFVGGGDGCPACMWGHIGRKLNMPRNWAVHKVHVSLGYNHNDIGDLEDGGKNLSYLSDAQAAATVMRRFAQKHFAPEQRHEPATQSFDEIMAEMKAEGVGQ